MPTQVAFADSNTHSSMVLFRESSLRAIGSQSANGHHHVKQYKGLKKMLSLQTLILVMVALQVAMAAVLTYITVYISSERSIADLFDAYDGSVSEFEKSINIIEQSFGEVERGTSQLGKVISSFGSDIEKLNVDRMKDHIENYLGYIPQAMLSVRHTFRAGYVVPIQSFPAPTLWAAFRGILEQYKSFDWLYWGSEASQFDGVTRLTEDSWWLLTTVEPFNVTVVAVLNDTLFKDGAGELSKGDLVVSLGDYDPRTRPWYTPHIGSTPETGKLFWTDPYTSATPPVVTLTASFPFYDTQTNEFIGVVGADQHLSVVQQFLKESLPTTNSRVVLVNNAGILLSASHGKDQAEVVDQETGETSSTPITVFESDRATIVFVSEQLRSTQQRVGENHPFSQIPAEWSSIMNCCEKCCEAGANGSLSVSIRRLDRADLNIDWLLVTIIPEADILAELWLSQAQVNRSQQDVLTSVAGVEQAKVSAQDSRDAAYEQVLQGSRLSIGLACAALVVALIVALITTMCFITRPLSQLQEDMVHLANLDFKSVSQTPQDAASETQSNAHEGPPADDPHEDLHSSLGSMLFETTTPGINSPMTDGAFSPKGRAVTFGEPSSGIPSSRSSDANPRTAAALGKRRRPSKGVERHNFSHLYEIGEMQKSVALMKKALISFEKYVPAELVRQVLAQENEATLGVKLERVSIFFSDIENFTGLTEGMDPKLLVHLMADYLSNMSTIIEREKGTVDKFIGDAIMAFWNAPIPVEDHPIHACKAALHCQAKLAQLSPTWQQKYGFTFVTRTGVNTGKCMVGNIGAKNRFNYTLLGDQVNLTSRLESLNKVYHTNIMISDAVYNYKNVRNRFTTRWLDVVMVKGRESYTSVFELVGDSEDLSVIDDGGPFITPTGEGNVSAGPYNALHHAISEGNSKEVLSKITYLIQTHPHQEYLKNLQSRIQGLVSDLENNLIDHDSDWFLQLARRMNTK